MNSRSLCLSATKSLSSLTTKLLSVPELRGIGFSFTIIDFFANRPSSRPINIRGGNFSPIAISIAAEQCASACAGFILPHCRSLSGLSCAIRPFTCSTVAASKKFFMRKLAPRHRQGLMSRSINQARQRGRIHLLGSRAEFHCSGIHAKKESTRTVTRLHGSYRQEP